MPSRKGRPKARIQNPERFVRALYLGVLGREADDRGLARWVQAIADGMSPAEVVEAFIGSEEFQRKAATKLFVPPGHFYSPIVDPVEADRRLVQVESEPVPSALPGLDIDRREMTKTWMALLPFMKTAPFRQTRVAPLRYAYDNSGYSWADGSTLHAMLRLHRPKRLIEIGCGWSSACTIDTVEQYLEGTCALTFVEPYPQLLLDLIGDAASSVEILECPLQDVPLQTFDQLSEGDVLFIDSTHVLRTGSDVCRELLEILPRLAPGVLVHLHDMFWPFEYPRAWAVDENRSWNELYAVRAVLPNNDPWRVLLFNDYLAKLERPMIERTFPDFLRNTGGALWLQRGR